MIDNPPKAVLITGASGSGKSLSLEFLKQACPELSIFPKHTTRERRPDEQEGIHYNYLTEDNFRKLEENNAFLHIKKSDYAQNLYGISSDVLDGLSSEGKIPCFTSHGMDEAVDVKQILGNYGLNTIVVYVYTPEEKRVEHLLNSAQKEKLLKRYHADVGFKQVAYRSMFDGCDFVIFNGSDIKALEHRIVSIGQWVVNPSSQNKPKKILNGDLVRIKKDIESISTETASIIGTSENNFVSHITDSILAEYNVLREEIKQYHSDRTNYINFSVGLTIGLVVLISSKDITGSYRSIVLILSPFLYSILAFLYIDKSFRVIRIADYIENSLRPRLEQLLNHTIFHWENYKRETEIFPKWVVKSLDRLRLLIFIGPAIGALLAWFIIYYTAASGYEHSIGIAGSLVILFALLLNQMTQETTGAKRKDKNIRKLKRH